MEQYIFPIFSLIIIFILFAMLWHADTMQDAREKHIKSLKIGSKVKILDGYFQEEVGEISDYVPYSIVHPSGFFQDGTCQREGFKVKIKDKVHFFEPSELELAKEN